MGIRTVRYFLTIVATALGSPSTAHACGCTGTLSSLAAVKTADVIFVGTVAKVEFAPSRSHTNADGSVSVSGGLGPIGVTFDVSRTYKGRAEQQVVIPNTGTDCDEPFQQNETWLVYARVSNGKVVTNKCTRTRLRANASSDLVYLDGLEQKRPLGIVYGDVLRRITRAGGQPALQGLFELLQVVAVSDGRRTEITTDPGGAYKLALPPGEYEIWVERNGRPVGEKESARIVEGAERRLALTVQYQAPLPPTAPVDLTGTIDIHIHSYPDNRPRSIDALEAARQAKQVGMRAIVLKNHYEFTSGWAYLIRSVVPGIEVFGGVDLNRPVGGINLAAVEYMAATSGGFGRMVWMPTFDAENQVRYSKESRPFVRVSDKGRLLQPVRDVIASIASHNLVLATGHSSPAEVLLLLQEGKRRGVKHMVVTHAMNPPVLMTVDQMRAAAALGAFIEFVGGNVGDSTGTARMDRFADAIRRIGPDRCILSSDLGQQNNPLPTVGFAAFLAQLRARGFSDAELDLMSRGNPARLLDLP